MCVAEPLSRESGDATAAGGAVTTPPEASHSFTESCCSRVNATLAELGKDRILTGHLFCDNSSICLASEHSLKTLREDMDRAGKNC